MNAVSTLKSSSSIPKKIRRPFASALMVRMASTKKETSDWNASRYMKFGNERTRAARDLLAQVPLQSPRNIIDLGCGPGNSTELLRARYPDSKVTGMDSSPNMLETARTTLPDIEFTLGDLRTYKPDSAPDLLFSNAVFQWLSADDRIKTIQRLLETQPSGGVFAIQVPDNLNEPSHASMRETAADGPWASILEAAKPARDVMETPEQLYDALKPLCSSVDIWHTRYNHCLENHQAIVDFISSTGLRPFLEPLSEDHRKEFLEKYLARLEKAYPKLYDGRVLLRFPRLFLILVRK